MPTLEKSARAEDRRGLSDGLFIALLAAVVAAVLFIFNLIPFMGFFKEGIQIQNGVIVNFPFMNFFVIIMMIVLAVCLLAKKRIDNMEEGREDCL